MRLRIPSLLTFTHHKLHSVCRRLGEVYLSLSNRLGTFLPCVEQVDVRDKWQFTPLHSAANGGHVSTIWKLIQFSHEVDVRDYLGQHSLPFCPKQTCMPQASALQACRCSEHSEIDMESSAIVTDIEPNVFDDWFIYGGLSSFCDVQVDAPCTMQPCMGAWVPWKPW